MGVWVVVGMRRQTPFADLRENCVEGGGRYSDLALICVALLRAESPVLTLRTPGGPRILVENEVL